jgi:two-component system LytT family response regulator
MLKVLIADDENLARETVKLLLSSIPEVSEVYEAENGNQARILANQHQPDIVILDIEMPKMSGIEVSKHLPKKSIIIFATAYNEYAVEAFQQNAIDYILKPFDDDRFYGAFERAKERCRDTNTENYSQLTEIVQQIMADSQPQHRQRLVIRDSGRIRLIDVDRINYITGAGNYAEIHLSDGKQVLHRQTLCTLENQLDPKVFVRIHRLSIIRCSYISELRPNDKGDYNIILQSGEMLTLSRRYRSKLDELTL